MIADHHEHHRQREVRVVHGALFATQAGRGIGLPPLALGMDQLPLTGNDHEQYVRHHDGSQGTAEDHEGAAPAEQVTDAPRLHRDQQGHRTRQHVGLSAERRAAQRVIDQPRGDQHAHGDADRRRFRQRRDRRIDEVGLGPNEVEQAEQAETGQPGGIGFPIEPMQRLRQHRRGDPVFLRPIEAPAVHRPELAADARVHSFGLGHRPQMIVEPDEIERCADPGDACNHVQPAHEQPGPVEQVSHHPHILISFRLRL